MNKLVVVLSLIFVLIIACLALSGLAIGVFTGYIWGISRTNCIPVFNQRQVNKNISNQDVKQKPIIAIRQGCPKIFFWGSLNN